MKVLSVVGTRPEFVMAVPVSRQVRANHEGVLVHTGQHYDASLSDVFVSELGVDGPEYNLGGASADAPLQWADVVSGLRAVVDQEDPDAVLVYGDTNSALAGAVAAAGTAPLVHVEAGLRSGDPAMAEERNRILVDHLADIRFAPTDAAVENLGAEGLAGRTHQVGDLLEDAVASTRDVARRRSSVLASLGITPGEFVLATVHRAENADHRARLGAILDGLAASPLPVVLPAHPRTVDRLREFGLYGAAEGTLELVDPLGYLDFLRLLDAADRVATDSGGVQKEAGYLGTPCVTLREETEWPETVAQDRNVLVGADATAIRHALGGDLDQQTEPAIGDGQAVTDRILDVLVDRFARSKRRVAVPEST